MQERRSKRKERAAAGSCKCCCALPARPQYGECAEGLRVAQEFVSHESGRCQAQGQHVFCRQWRVIGLGALLKFWAFGESLFGLGWKLWGVWVMCRKLLCVAGAIPWRRFLMVSCSFRGRHSTLETSIVIWRGRRSTSERVFRESHCQGGVKW